jgi:acyl carrier protein
MCYVPTNVSDFQETGERGVVVAGKGLTVEEIAGIVIGLLADKAGVPADQMRADLEATGPGLPVDSVLIAEILSRVEEACGARVPADAEAARSTGSVMALARTVQKAIPIEGGTA